MRVSFRATTLDQIAPVVHLWIRRSFRYTRSAWSRSVAVGLAAVLCGACGVEIGDECRTSSDCSQAEPRLCLTDALEGFPGGYCTAFNCEPGTCPSEAICVAYRSTLSSSQACQENLTSSARLQRTFCMRSCSSNSDCRSGYRCLDLAEPNPWGAEPLESPGTSGKVCALAYKGPETPEDRPSEICLTPAPEFESDAGEMGSRDASVPVDAGRSDAGTPPFALDGAPPMADSGGQSVDSLDATLPASDASPSDASLDAAQTPAVE